MAYRFMCFPEGRKKALTFSYDDGSIFDLNLAEIFNKYGLKATFNLNSARLGDGSGISISDAKQLISDGHEIAVHGKYHLANGISYPIDGIRDVLLCREELEEYLGMIIRGMAYPDTGITNFANSTDYASVRSYLSQLGIVYSRTLGGDNNRFQLPEDWYSWMPTAHHENPDIFSYIDEFLGLDLDNNYCAMRHPRLFYIWGHSFEFHHNNNWDRIERICECFRDRNDVWFATNIEIFEYVEAYNSLVRSADGKRIYNPTLITVYFYEGDTLYTVESGQTLIVD